MAKRFRSVLRDQPMLLPVDMRQWLPADHLVWFVLDVVDALDTSRLEQATSRRGGAGAAGFDPRMLLALVVYAYCMQVRSSRRIEQLCVTDVAFRVLCAQDGPDHATIARFRARAGAVFTDLFAQVLMIAAKSGMVSFTTVAIDGTKVAADASIDANRGRSWFEKHAADLVAEAERVDRAEDEKAARDGEDRLDRVADGLADGAERRFRIDRAIRELRAAEARTEQADKEHAASARRRLQQAKSGKPMVGRIPSGEHHLAEARAHLDRQITIHQAKLDRYAEAVAAGRKPMGRPPVPLDQAAVVIRARKVVARAEQIAADRSRQGKPARAGLPTIVANITDPDSRIMPTRRGFLQGYNVQVAVTADHMIAAVDVGQSPNDQQCFIPMVQAVQQAASRLHDATAKDQHVIGTVLADAGYHSRHNLSAPGPDRLIAPGKGRDQARAAHTATSGPLPAGATPIQANAHRLLTKEGRKLYKRRGATVEPGIGNLKKILPRFCRRGLTTARQEATLAATAFNIIKIYRAHTAPC